MKVNLFTTPSCTRCPAVKDFLKRERIEFDEIDVSTPEGMTEARVTHGVFTKSVPVVQVGRVVIHTSIMFKGDNFDEKSLYIPLGIER